MLLDSIIVGVVVAGAVAYLAWAYFPRRRAKPLPCGACARTGESKPVSVPVKIR